MLRLVPMGVAGLGHLYRPTYRPKGAPPGSPKVQSAVWWWRFRGRRVSTGCRDYDAAHAWRLDRLHELARGSNTGICASLWTYEDMEALLRAHYEARQAVSLHIYEARAKHLRAYFVGRLAASISAGDVDAYTVRRRKEGAAVATINLEKAFLRRMFRLSVRDRRLLPEHIPAVSMTAGATIKRDVLDYESVRAVADLMPVQYRHLIAFLALTGWRQGEALGLTMDRVDLGTGTLILDKSKTGQPRLLPLEQYPQLREEIEAQAKLREKWRTLSPFFFCQPDGRPIQSQALRCRWQTATRRAGVPEVGLHSLRRLMVQSMESAGVPWSVGMLVTGMASLKTYMRYAVTPRAAVNVALAKMSAHLGRASKVVRLRS